MDKTPWSVPVTVENIPDTGLHMEIEAPAAVRAAVAELAAVRDLPQLSAVFDLTRQGADGAGAHVSGRVSALVWQTCVVTLEPIESKLDEAIDVSFGPPGAAPSKDTDEPPEPLANGRVDLGALAIEFLILGIDPYPRKQGVQFAPPKVEEAGEHPFAVLAPLKKSSGGGES
jgi:uncharacterized metal-binding protein YceD (DUF177 family)